jgi:hypothetical protein
MHRYVLTNTHFTFKAYIIDILTVKNIFTNYKLNSFSINYFTTKITTMQSVPAAGFCRTHIVASPNFMDLQVIYLAILFLERYNICWNM